MGNGASPKGWLKLVLASVGLAVSRLVLASTTRTADHAGNDRQRHETDALFNRLQREIRQLRADWTALFLQSGPLNADAILRKAAYLDILDRRIEALRNAPSARLDEAVHVRAEALAKAVAKQQADLDTLRRARSAR